MSDKLKPIEDSSVKSFLEELVEESPHNMRRFQQERALLELNGIVERVMREGGVTRSALAGLLGKTKGFVTQVLDGEANRTIRTFSDVLTCLGRELHFFVKPIRIAEDSRTTLHVHMNYEQECNPTGAVTSNDVCTNVRKLRFG